MGVPVITLAGRTHLSRVGASLLKAVHRDELIAGSEEGYVDLAIALARDAVRRRQLHATLRQQVQESHLADVPRFIAELEEAYYQIWRDHIRDVERVSVQQVSLA